MGRLPWIEYSGQTTAELVACKHTHRIDSILCAFEWGIQAKAKAQGEQSLTAEEELVLACMALDREVNNGGYDQFFVNSSYRFASIVVDCLRRIGAQATAEITERAIAALGLTTITAEAANAAIFIEDPRRKQIHNECDNEFYKIEEIGEKLFPFVEAHQDRIQLVQGTQPPIRRSRTKRSDASRLCTYLSFNKDPDRSFENLRRLAYEIALEREIPVTDQTIEAAVFRETFREALHVGNLENCEAIASRAFALICEDTLYCVWHRDWVRRLIGANQSSVADTWTVKYLEYLKNTDQAWHGIYNRILFCAALLQKHRAVLSTSTQFFVTTFRDIDLNQELPRERFTDKTEKPKSDGSG